jgi:hypothetical protein
VARLLETAFLGFLIASQIASQPPVYRTEREPLAGGAELITVFGRSRPLEPGAQGPQIPLVSVLRDTLGSSDPDSLRLRYVWVLTSTKPTLLQRTASALSFVWFRTGGKQHADQVPSPVMDLASPARSVWSNLAGDTLQALQLDGRGAPIRSSTRSYRGNFNDYRQLQVFRALGALDALSQQPENQPVWSSAELHQVYSRLSLSNHTFGGLVRDQNVEKFYDKETARRAEIRGHNWELLRQRAEANGLYFEPLELAGQTPTEALLWIARRDVALSQARTFDRQFLGIANPWTDERILHWTGYSEFRYFDRDNRPVPQGTPDARAVELIPLALYSLDYPRVPLLLVDFRSSLAAKKRELVQHGASAVLTGFLGITSFGNWSFLAANSAWTFVRGRQGAPIVRSERLRSYSEAREFLAEDSRLTPQLKSELLHRLDHLALDPLENGLDTEARVAKEQFAALTQYAHAPDGLVARLERDRQKELAAYIRPLPFRLAANFASLLRIRPSHANSEAARAARDSELQARRQAAAHVRYLKALLASSPRPEVVADSAQIRHAIDTLSQERFPVPHASQLIAKVFERSQSFDVRMACLAGLRRADTQEARSELLRLSRDPNQSDFWRAATLASVHDDSEAATAAGSGQF